MSSKLQLPLKYLQEAKGNNVLVKLKDGGEFIGELDFSDATMNVILKNCTEVKERTEEPKAKYGTILIRGSQILFISLDYKKY
ncbi:MAG: ribonucleoprotein [Thermoprotei archaeon]|jgi:small nuclear ribonucleoprotein|uniref:Sm ribonucleo n=1 Tax=Fervidicoccus fontis TaxID=683846 RepID=A0A7J3SM80_9CREN|nr:ribonucleoprotein [Thermoprotei archaeon]